MNCKKEIDAIQSVINQLSEIYNTVNKKEIEERAEEINSLIFKCMPENERTQLKSKLRTAIPELITSENYTETRKNFHNLTLEMVALASD